MARAASRTTPAGGDTRPAESAAAPRDSAARRVEIIRGAVKVFAEHGYDGSSLRELAAGAGMQKGHLTYYFPTKDDLLFEIVDDLHDQFLAGILAWAQDPAAGPGERLRHIFHEHVVLVCADYQQTRVAYEGFRFLTPERRVVVSRKRARYELELARHIDACRSVDGLVCATPTTLLTKAVLGALNWPYQWYSPSGSLSPDELAHELSSRAMAMLRPEPAPG